MLLLDASKAFDRVEYVKLFNILRDRGVCPVVLRLIKNLKKSNIGCRYGSEYMGVYGYADDLSLLWLSFSGLKGMLNICERYANNKKITFNATKSQLLYFSKKDDPLHIKKSILRMKHGQIIPYVEKCIYLGNTLNSSSVEHAMLDSAIIDLNIKTNNLLSEFSFS